MERTEGERGARGSWGGGRKGRRAGQVRPGAPQPGLCGCLGGPAPAWCAPACACLRKCVGAGARSRCQQPPGPARAGGEPLTPYPAPRPALGRCCRWGRLRGASLTATGSPCSGPSLTGPRGWPGCARGCFCPLARQGLHAALPRVADPGPGVNTASTGKAAADTQPGAGSGGWPTIPHPQAV